MDTKISTIFTLIPPFLLPSPLPLVPTSRQDLFYFPVLRLFFKDIFVRLW
jgi:hypothetical protein